jgi:hypothetical protein
MFQSKNTEIFEPIFPEPRGFLCQVANKSAPISDLSFFPPKFEKTQSYSGDCSTLVNCATDCVTGRDGNLTIIGNCLRQTCAINCFDGGCPRCSAFITRIFNQICVSGQLRQKVRGFQVKKYERNFPQSNFAMKSFFQGQCYQLFRAIIDAKFGADIRASSKGAVE